METTQPQIRLSPHSVGRFHERFRPALDQIRARAELERLLAHGEIVETPPDWMARKMRSEADAYLIVGDDLILPLAAAGPLGEFIAKTCIDRGGMSEKARRSRNERLRQRRAARRTKRRKR